MFLTFRVSARLFVAVLDKSCAGIVHSRTVYMQRSGSLHMYSVDQGVIELKVALVLY